MSSRDYEQKAGEQEDTRLEREALLRAVVDTSPDGLITIDEKGIVQSFNPAAAAMLGYCAEEVVGRNISCLMPSPDRERHDGYLARYLRTGERRIIGIGREVRAQRKDGTTFPIELAVGEVVADGRRMFAGFLRDITARREAEQRLHQMRGELLHVSRLSEMGEMASALAHELNQPLTAITNYMQACRRLLAGGPLDSSDKVNELMGKSILQAERAGQIIQHLRRFIARGETEHTAEDICKVVEESADLALVGAGVRGITSSLDLSEEMPPALIDKIQIQQVIINLTRNAVDALSEIGGGQIAIRARRAGLDLVEIEVCDNGPGLNKTVAERLFQPFVTTKPGGLGIGLSICHTIVEAHEGKLWVTENPGGGTIFHLTLPLDTQGDRGHAG
ncbi:MAG: PAS domain S-box protein [Pseudomonadota bacterium]